MNATDRELRLSDVQKRHARNCDGDGIQQAFDWAPELDRCPKSMLTPDVWLYVHWWQDWKRGFGLPWNSREVLDEPHFVYEAFRTCEIASERAQQELLKDL